MARIEPQLAETVNEVILALADEAASEEQRELLGRLAVLRRLELSNTHWSASDFLRAEVERALGD